MDQKLQQAISAIKSKNRKTGYNLLVEVIKENPKSADAEIAWLWMSRIMSEPQKKLQCYESVLKINPDNEIAKAKLAELNKTIQFNETSASRTLEKIKKQSTKQCPFCAETIKTEAIICRFCGRNLTETNIEQIKGYEDSKHQAKNQNDIRDVGKTTAGVALGILSAPVILVVGTLLLLMVCCASCSFLSGSNNFNSPYQSTQPNTTKSLPATYTPVSNYQINT